MEKSWKVNVGKEGAPCLLNLSLSSIKCLLYPCCCKGITELYSISQCVVVFAYSLKSDRVILRGFSFDGRKSVNYVVGRLFQKHSAKPYGV